ncbi:MAG: aminoglycoside phosphotransferase family protein [Hamadaea sp.]|nr:aminoglycoside phosphotransferase family protein [Hamadaea sp.]
MDSITRRALGPDDVRAYIRSGLGEDVVVVGQEEFTDGYYNAAHGVSLSDGREVVLKVAPLPEVKVLTYEFDIMRAEIEFFARAEAAGVPVPKLWHADPDSGYLIMERIDGVSLAKAKEEMSAEEKLPLRRRIGELCSRIAGVPGELFGYPRRDGRTRSTSWRESFLQIVADILADAAAGDRELPRTASEITALMRRHAHLLDEVTEPRLIHFDLWDGNVFVRRTEDGWDVAGFIDGERALYGDPLVELVSLTSFVDGEEKAAVVDGFLGRPLTEAEEVRLCMYRCYLWLILLAELGFRGYPAETEKGVIAWATPLLVADLARLDEAATTR